MITTAELENFIKTAAYDYLRKDIPLNDSIIKLANDNGLNRDQISRVVEGANTEVYIQKFNTTDDKYVQFENASHEKIAEAVFGVTKIAEAITLDYDEAPLPDLLEIEMDKTASTLDAQAVKLTTDTEAMHEYYKLAALENKMSNALFEVEIQYQADADKFQSMIKQAVLGGTEYGDIHKALTSVYDAPVVAVNLEEIRTKLAEQLPGRVFNANSSTTGSINMENLLVKQAALLVKHAQEYINVRTKKQESTQLLKEALRKEGGLINGVRAVGGAMINHPKIVAGSVAAGVGLGIAADKHIRDVRDQQAAAPTKTIPQRAMR